MANNTPSKHREISFNPQTLQDMQEPLTVRVEKVKGNGRTPIEIPAVNGTDNTGAPGTGWTRDGILKIENWILTEWSGGGFYHFKVVDANNKTMEWQSVYDPKTYPERVPPNALAAVQMQQPQQQQAPQQPQMSQMQQPVYANPAPSYTPPPTSGPLGQTSPTMPLGSSYGPQPQMPQQVYPPPPAAPTNGNGLQVVAYDTWNRPVYGPVVSPPTQPPLGASTKRRTFEEYEDDYVPRRAATPWNNFARTPAPAAPTTDGEDRRRHEDEIRRREEEIRRLENEKREGEYRAALERQQQENARQMEALRQELRTATERKAAEEAEAIRREREERERIERQAREQLERMEREKERSMTDSRFAKLEELILKVAETSSKPKDTGVEETRRMLEETQRKHDEEMRRLREEQQRERDRIETLAREERLRQEMKEQAARTEALLREARESANKGPDPMLTFMQENSRIQAENQRELARLQQASTDRMAQMMMSPQSIMALIKDSSGGADNLLKSVVGSYSGIFETMKHAIEQVAQLTGGAPEPPAAQLLKEGLGRAGEIADRYMKMKQAENEADARARIAQAQAEAVKAQAQAVARSGRSPAAPVQAPAQAPTPTPPVQQAQPRPPVGPVTPSVPAEPAKPKTAATDDGTTDAATGQTVAKVIPMKQTIVGGEAVSDEQMFGIALPSVMNLRRGVKTFLAANGGNVEPATPAVDAEGKMIGLSPSAAIDAILQGVNYVTVNADKIPPVPVFTLFQQNRFADFMDVMLPAVDGIPQAFRDECIRILAEEVDMQPVGDDDDDDDDDDDHESA